MTDEIFVSLLLILLLVICFGFFYIWLLWIIADMTNP